MDMLGAWIMELFFCMFKLIMGTPIILLLRLRRSTDLMVWITVWLIFATYDYSILVGAVNVEEVLLASLALSWIILSFHHGVHNI